MYTVQRVILAKVANVLRKIHPVLLSKCSTYRDVEFDKKRNLR